MCLKGRENRRACSVMCGTKSFFFSFHRCAVQGPTFLQFRKSKTNLTGRAVVSFYCNLLLRFVFGSYFLSRAGNCASSRGRSGNMEVRTAQQGLQEHCKTNEVVNYIKGSGRGLIYVVIIMAFTWWNWEKPQDSPVNIAYLAAKVEPPNFQTLTRIAVY